MFIQSTHFVEVLITLQKNVSKGSDRKRKKLLRLLIQTIDKWDGRHGNVLDVDLKITKLQNFRNHQRKMRKGESNYVLMQKGIVHWKTTKITVTKRYMHQLHEFLVMTNVRVEILVIVGN